MNHNITAGQLRRAADIKDKLVELTGELDNILGVAEFEPVKRRYKMSRASRMKIAAGARARWARVKATR